MGINTKVNSTLALLNIIMVLSIQYLAAAGNADFAGLWIPVSELPGLTADELAVAESVPAKEGKTQLALLNKLYLALSLATTLGFTIAKQTPSGAGIDRITQSFSATWQKMVNIRDAVTSVIPLPTTGANLGLGGFTIADVFPTAAKVAAAADVSAAGIVISDAALAAFDAGLAYAVNTDSRRYFIALVDYIASNATLRTATVQSGVTALALSNIGSTSIPTNFTQSDPLSGIIAADLPVLGIITRTTSFTVDLSLNQSTQKFDVRVATS
jgi:hypothetical protein